MQFGFQFLMQLFQFKQAKKMLGVILDSKPGVEKAAGELQEAAVGDR
jgi:hypothetical protein